jgi:hypothetical protein
MQLIRILLAVAVVLGPGASGGYAGPDQKQAKPAKRPIIIRDPSAFRAPPPPHERNYVGPGPSRAAPMERIPQVAPLAQPPIPR